MKNSTTLLRNDSTENQTSLISKKQVKFLLPYFTLLLLALTVGILGFWMAALALGALGSITIYIHRLVTMVNSINWLDDKLVIRLEDIVDDLEREN